MVLPEAVTHKGFENPLRLNLSNPVDSDKSGEHEICSSIHDRFRCAYVASVGRFAPALSDQTNAAISRRYDCDRRRFASRHAQEGAGQRAKVGAKKLSNTGVPPVRPGRSCPVPVLPDTTFTDTNRSAFGEAGAGIEPANSGFADRDLTTWLPRQIARSQLTGASCTCQRSGNYLMTLESIRVNESKALRRFSALTLERINASWVA